jgi:hypothetical protein
MFSDSYLKCKGHATPLLKNHQNQKLIRLERKYFNKIFIMSFFCYVIQHGRHAFVFKFSWE